MVVIEKSIKENDYCDLYQELAALLSNPDDVKVIHDRFKGLSISFPKKLYSKQYVYRYVEKYFGKKSIREIAVHLDLSERRIRQIASELRNR